jgi:hypothetical protein
VRTYTQTIWARLDDIRIGERRRGVDVAKVERYREWLEQGRAAPPVRLVRGEDGYVVRDGRHRVFAAIAAGSAVIEAEVQKLLGRTLRALAAVLPGISWGRSSGGRAPRLQRGGVGSTPAVSTVGPQHE